MALSSRTDPVTGFDLLKRVQDPLCSKSGEGFEPKTQKKTSEIHARIFFAGKKRFQKLSVAQNDFWTT
jgi:hypothetical protein